MDAAIIFADLLLPLEVMGLPFHFEAGEGPVIESRCERRKTWQRCAPIAPPNWATWPKPWDWWRKHFGDTLPVIGFCGAPFTLASYMIEGGGSRNYVHTKKMMYPRAARLG